MPNWENLGIAGAILFVVMYLGTKLIDAWSKNRGNSIVELCNRIDSFTDVNNELLRVLAQSLVMFEKDQKEILNNLQQLSNVMMNIVSCTTKIEERTNLTNGNNK